VDSCELRIDRDGFSLILSGFSALESKSYSSLFYSAENFREFADYFLIAILAKRDIRRRYCDIRSG